MSNERMIGDGGRFAADCDVCGAAMEYTEIHGDELRDLGKKTGVRDYEADEAPEDGAAHFCPDCEEVSPPVSEDPPSWDQPTDEEYIADRRGVHCLCGKKGVHVDTRPWGEILRGGVVVARAADGEAHLLCDPDGVLRCADCTEEA